MLSRADIYLTKNQCIKYYFPVKGENNETTTMYASAKKNVLQNTFGDGLYTRL